MKTLICDCNRTMPLDGPALSRVLSQTPGAQAEGLETVHTLLCRREAPAFQRAAMAGDELLVACTQESRLFEELNDATTGTRPVAEQPIRFVNIREMAGWSHDARAATPKIAALIAAAQLPEPEPVASVSYRSGGRVLVIGDAERGQRAVSMLADRLQVIQLVDATQPGEPLPQQREHLLQVGRLSALRGWLGAFEAEWTTSNPIDLELCTRCNACISACPEGAIGFDYQVNLAACKSHRDCVRACDAAGAIDFQRGLQTHAETVDLVLDLREQPAFTQHQPPQGYFHVGGDVDGAERRLVDAVLQLREMSGEFEKPKFFQYKPSLCAHSRNQQIGCQACIDVCSAQAIRSDATLKGKRPGRSGVRGPADAGSSAATAVPAQLGGIVVEPHLCVGCGACSTVCPSGAMSFSYPRPADQGRRWRTLLSTYARAGGHDAALLLHSEEAGTRWLSALGRAARSDKPLGDKPRSGKRLRGVPARVLPVSLWHTASTGLELWLGAIAQGAAQVWLLFTDEEAPAYREAVAAQMAVAQAILSGLGYAGEHFRIIDVRSEQDLPALDAALQSPSAQSVRQPAGFNALADKRASLDMALTHLLAQAPARPEAITLPAAGSPFGSLKIDTAACTLCLSCVGACPSAALADNPERPQLKFIEANCVQCGLCATTCPEDAITLQPRLWLAGDGQARKQSRVLHEVEPYRCVRCSKPFGTLRAIENMMAKLSGHAAFQGAAAERLKMCGDCRVIDIHSNPNELRITDL